MEEEEEAVAPDEDGVAGRDDEVLCADVADERFKAGVAEDGLDTSGQRYFIRNIQLIHLSSHG